MVGGFGCAGHVWIGCPVRLCIIRGLGLASGRWQYRSTYSLSLKFQTDLLVAKPCSPLKNCVAPSGSLPNEVTLIKISCLYSCSLASLHERNSIINWENQAKFSKYYSGLSPSTILYHTGPIEYMLSLTHTISDLRISLHHTSSSTSFGKPSFHPPGCQMSIINRSLMSLFSILHAVVTNGLHTFP